jgi:hypothetical protein
MLFQCGKQDGVILRSYASTAQHYAVQSAELLLVLPEAFTHDPFNPITRRRRLDNLAGDSQTQAWPD